VFLYTGFHLKYKYSNLLFRKMQRWIKVYRRPITKERHTGRSVRIYKSVFFHQIKISIVYHSLDNVIHLAKITCDVFIVLCHHVVLGVKCLAGWWILQEYIIQYVLFSSLVLCGGINSKPLFHWTISFFTLISNRWQSPLVSHKRENLSQW